MLKVNKDRSDKVSPVSREGGFTIIELMIAAALSLIVMTGIYSVYRSQSRSYIVREQITVMQQNLRAGMVVMTSDIRMAGYVHPAITLNSGEVAGITVANTTDITFQLLKDKSDEPASNTVEQIKYSLDSGNLVKQVADLGNTLGAPQVLAENVDWLDFVYLNASGNVTATVAEIKSIQVTMVARSGRGDPDYTDSNTYRNQNDTRSYSPPAGDRFRRRILSREIKCRNL